MRREALRDLRRGLRPGPDYYEYVDLRLATKLGGALFLIGIAYVLIVLPLAPPDSATRWAGVAACLSVAFVSSLALLRAPQPMSPRALLLFAGSGIGVATAYRWFAGDGAPFGQLLLLATLYGAAVHHAPRAFALLGLATAGALTPMLYEPGSAEFTARTAGDVALIWSLSLVILFWMTRTRRQRREARLAHQQADALARADALTGLGNRRALEEALPAAVAAARREGRPASVVVADLDAVKRINDTFGHAAGDAMIKAAAAAFTTAVRIPDPCFRFGGDEFVAILPGATLEEAREVGSRVSSAVALGCRTPDGRPVRITVGVAELQDGESGEDLFIRADAELLAAKAARPLSRAAG